MAKSIIPQSSSSKIAVAIFVLLILSVVLLVFVLRGQLHHESTLSATAPKVIGGGDARATTPKGAGPPLIPTTGRPQVVQRPTPSPDIQSDSSDHTPAMPDSTPWLDFRLPRYIRPLHYDLRLQPDLQTDVFSGEVNVTVNVTQGGTRHFVVHAYRLSVRECGVFDEVRQQGVRVEKSFAFSPHEYFVVTTEKGVEPGLYKLCFDFGGSLNGSIIGFYKSRYKNANNETRYLATSKFQPTYARRAFPCFDEPSFKSTFSVALVHEQDQIALSNMPVQDIEPVPDSNLFITKFQKSVPMVTYLACFIVSDFQFKGTTTSSGKPFHVYTTPDQVNLTTYALKFGSRVLDYFEKYFGIDYPLPKQDMVAIPDFASGAMEHWGVITFRETNLLHDPLNSSPQNLQRISAVIAHEMAHMWFGNLVTMEWWDDLWLNEGFASYVEYKGVDEQHPQWDTMSQFVTEELQPVMNIDSTMSSHPIVQPVVHPDEITEIFDDISYGKGASVLRMLEFFVGKDNFRTGISNFLKKYQYRNAKTGDLWEELSEACGHPGNHTISSIMKTWTEQMGFPYINVVRRGQNSSFYVAKQKRFLKNEALHRQDIETSPEYVWTVPLSYVTGRGDTGILWLQDEKEMRFSVHADHSDWVKFNVNQTGFYLVNYEKEEWERFIHLLTTNHSVLTPSDRSNLLFDAFLLAEGGHIQFDVFFSMSMYLKNETHLIPWATAYASFVYLCQLLEATEVNVLLKSYIRDLTNNLYKNLGWKTSENHLDNLLRTTIIGLACHSGNEECLSYASELFQNWTQGQDVPSSLRSMVYNFGMAEIGREEHWNYMWSRYLVEESPAQKKAIMNGLAHVRKPELILRYLEYAMDGERVRSQDFFTILSYIAGNPIGRPLVWNFVREKWPLLVEKFTLNNRYLGNAVKKICGYFTTDSELHEMIAFFTKYPDAGAGKRRRQQALEVVNNNIKWIETYSRGVKTWLESEGPAPWHHPRLPPHAVPLHYDLLLHPALDKDRFSGTVAIQVQLQKPSSYFLVHASADLNVTKMEVTSGEEEDAKTVSLEEVFRHQDHDYLVLKTEERLPVERYKLYFEFEGPLTVSLKGLYKSSYFDSERKEKRYLATTQFAAVYARRAFPCFDEPSFKSTFNVSVVHNSTHFALSNSAVESVTSLQNNLQLTKFEKSLPMVTYLLCVVVSDFEFKENITDNGVKLRVYSAPHHVEKTYYALDVAARVLTYYEAYFGIPFPLKKLDLVAVPDMFYAAMENWGLVTFAEEQLIAENSSSIATKHSISRIIAHELAHMWFGDLVTMKWWNEVWLNEGFATYIAQKGLQHVEPHIDKENDDGVKSLTTAMRSDQSIHSHPIVHPVEKVTSQIYDDIQYLKGSSMLRMLEGYIGQDFSSGVSSYLKRYSFRNARTEDLWDAFTISSKEGLNVSSMMDTWTRQMNYPFVTLERSGDQLLIGQQRFLEDPMSRILSTQRSPYNYVWQIPLTYRTSESDEVSYVLLNSSETINVSMPKHSWTKFNVDFSGYYSVNYDPMDWKIFTKILETNHTVLSPADRVNLLFDAFSLSTAGHLDYDVPLSLVRYLKAEEHHGAWRTALEELTRVKRFFKADREIREIIKEYIRSLSKDLLKKYGWEDSGDYSERELRKLIIQAACDNGNQDCLESAAYSFKQWMNGGNLSADTKSLVYVYGARVFSGEDTWNLMWMRYLAADDPYEKQILRDALTTFKNTTLLERLMKYAKNETLVRKQHYFDVLQKIAQNPKGFPLVTHLIFNKWPQLIKTYGLTESGEFVTNVFKGYSSEKDLEKVRDFHRRYPILKSGSRSRSLSLSNLHRNINWIRTHQPSVREWFRDNVYMPWKASRLPTHVTPTRYNVTLIPDMSRQTFEGSEEIEVEVKNETDYILVQESGLRIVKTELRSASGVDVPIEEELSYKRNEFHVIRLASAIPKGTYVLRMEFEGKFSQDGLGIQRYQYHHRHTGETRYLIATRFEATFARKAFPCFDEPAMKSKFKLTILHSGNHSAVSNMPEEEKVYLEDNLVRTVFEESVTMSTYLVFFVVSDFEYLEADYKGKSVRAYAPPDRLHEAEHGLNLTLKLLEKFEEFFDVPYVLPKLDSIAIPNYTVPGMEHWGAISYDTSRFLVNESITEYNRIVRVDRVIAHEIVHQWFGNLVTMSWWSDLWLNEGMSTMIMYVPLKQYHPSIEEVDVRKMSRMMCADSSTDSHPIVRDATTPDEIAEAFDVISYEKGGAVMKMLQHILKDDFRLGLSNFLKKYAYKNAETKDLWQELSNATSMDFNISEMMDTWTRQMGFPYVELKREGSTLTATQHWFSRNMNETVAAQVAKEMRYSSFGFIWKIPLVYKNLATGNERTLWLNEKTATFQINAMKEDVVKFNPGFVGFYIVKYDTNDWERLGQRLQNNHEAFGVTDRYNLLHDAFLLAETDRLVYDIPLELTKYLSKEKEALPWNLFRDHFLHLLRRMDGDSEAVGLLKAYVRNLTADLYDEYVFSAHNKSMFRKRSTGAGSCSYTYVDLEFVPTIVDLACRSANEKCLESANEDLQMWLLGHNVTSDLHFVMDVAISAMGNDSLWDYISDEMVADDTDDPRRYMLAEGLTSFTQPRLITKTIEIMAFHPKVSVDLAKFMFQSLSKKPKAIPYLWNYTKNHWDVLMNKLDAKNNPSIGISIFCDKLKTIKYLGEFIHLMKRRPEIGEFIVEGCVEEIQNSIEWSDKYEEALTSWLTWNVNQ